MNIRLTWKPQPGGRAFVYCCTAFLVLIGFLAGWTLSAEKLPLTISCAATPTDGAPPLTVKFQCKAVGGKGKYSYRWTFGEGSTSGEQNPAHTYERIGDFTAGVLVRSGTQSASWNQPIHVAVKKTVTVAGEGGASEIRFQATRGQKVRIHMQAQAAGMEPYGHLESASGGNYHPPNEGARDGVNSWEGKLPDTGKYVLTVFDGSNRGGSVTVTIEEAR
ncbi:MAG: PKD domain-containing protein [Armatimonadetes bacterium]|nr:PKD domain-containing protein [Armatimonadota bacterium]